MERVLVYDGQVADKEIWIQIGKKPDINEIDIHCTSCGEVIQLSDKMASFTLVTAEHIKIWCYCMDCAHELAKTDVRVKEAIRQEEERWGDPLHEKYTKMHKEIRV